MKETMDTLSKIGRVINRNGIAILMALMAFIAGIGFGCKVHEYILAHNIVCESTASSTETTKFDFSNATYWD